METIVAKVHGLAHDGRAVARTPNGMALFLPGALPGQEVLAVITQRKKNRLEGEVRELLSPGPDERPALCAHAEECGGCPWQRLQYPAQLRWKEQLLRDAFTRIGHLELPVPMRPIVWAGEGQARNSSAELGELGEWGYRNKMEFSFGLEEGELRLGLYRRNSRTIVEVEECRLQTRRTMRVLARIRAWAKQKENCSFADCLRFAVIREPQWERDVAEISRGDSGSCLVEIITRPVSRESAAGKALRHFAQDLLQAELGVSAVVHSLRKVSSDVAYGEKLLQSFGETGLREGLRLVPGHSPTLFQLGHNAFFQVNTRAAELLYQGVAALAFEANQSAVSSRAASGSATPTLCWDLYCGVGGLSVALAPHFDRVIGLETMPGAVALARQNAAGYPGLEFMEGDVAFAAKALAPFGLPNLVCADPPRAGLAPQSVKLLLDAAPRHILMVSCNPASLARDLALLQPRYNLESITPYDLFPQTPHVEALVLLRRRDG